MKSFFLFISMAFMVMGLFAQDNKNHKQSENPFSGFETYTPSYNEISIADSIANVYVTKNFKKKKSFKKMKDNHTDFFKQYYGLQSGDKKIVFINCFNPAHDNPIMSNIQVGGNVYGIRGYSIKVNLETLECYDFLVDNSK